MLSQNETASGACLAIHSGMNWLNQRLHSVRIIFTISLVLMASLSNNLAGAQQMCAELFGHESLRVPMAEMTETYERLLTSFATPQEITSEALVKKVEALEQNIQQYLDNAGISYEKIPQALQVLGLKDQDDFVFTYQLYALTGSKNGTRLARMMNGVNITSSFRKRNLRIVLDPLYHQHFNSVAHFRPDLMVILIPPLEFSQNFSSMGSSFRHEVAHAFEQIKLLEGKNTLGRITLESMMGRADKVYSDEFRADEIETHLLDFRTLSKVDTQKLRDDKLVQEGSDPEFIGKLKDFRKDIGVETRDLILGFTTSLRSVIEQVEAQLSKPKPWAKIQTIEETGDITLMFFTNDHYANVTLNLNGLIKTSETTDIAKVKQAVQQVLTWSKARAETVEKELAKSAAPAPPAP
jgi:hypothetical protein